MELLVAFRGGSAVAAFAEVVEGEDGLRGGRDWRGATILRVGLAIAVESAGRLAVVAAAPAAADVGADVGVVVAFAVDANELASAVVEGPAASAACGDGICEERKVYEIEKGKES